MLSNTYKGYTQSQNIITDNYGFIDAFYNPSIPQIIVCGLLLSFFVYKIAMT